MTYCAREGLWLMTSQIYVNSVANNITVKCVIKGTICQLSTKERLRLM